MPHERFHYHTLAEVRETARANGVELPLAEGVKPLLTPVELAGRTLPNRVFIQPIEGSDGSLDGAPGELTLRRYQRFAEGGAALLWFEAVSTAPEVRASANQLWMTRQNLGAFKRMVDDMKEAGLKANGFAPMVVMQATNSGRYSKPNGVPEPLVAHNCPPLEDAPIDPSRILTDDQLRAYEQQFGETARLAQAAGFDGMDVKCCHRYLASDLTSAFTREGEYGGSFENRTRFLKNAFRAARAEISGDFFLSCRLNVYDGYPHPWGFGVGEEGVEPNFTEPIRLIRELKDEFHIPFIDLSIGNPYRNPHVSRPYDLGNYVPDEHPLVGLARAMRCIAQVQAGVRDVPVIGFAFSYLRQFAPNLAAGLLEQGGCAMAGFGRLALAYPDFVRDLRSEGALDPRKVCVTCGGCAKLLRAGRQAGCIARDRAVYAL